MCVVVVVLCKTAGSSVVVQVTVEPTSGSPLDLTVMFLLPKSDRSVRREFPGIRDPEVVDPEIDVSVSEDPAEGVFHPSTGAMIEAAEPNA
jgi:hypothetical protein